MLDICLISFSSLKHDGRSLNILKALSQWHNVAAVSLTPQNDFEQLGMPKVEHFSINLNENSRHAFRWLEFNKQVKNLSEKLRSRIILACDLYSLSSAVSLKKASNSKVFYDSREIYSALGPLSGSAIKQIVLSSIEKHLIKNVDEFIVSGELDADYLRNYFKTQKKFHVILNVPPFKQAFKNNLIREKYPYLNGKTLLIYQGAVLPGRGLDQALNILAEDARLGLAVMGDGFYLPVVKEKAQKMGLLPQIAFCGNLPYDELHNWTCSADIGLNLIEPISFSYRLALPNKMFEYILAGIPQLASDLPAMRKIIDQYRIGESISELSNTGVILEKIAYILEHKSLYEMNCSTASEIFNYEKQIEKLKIIFAK